ncbi:MAG: NUDIX domain-containing protein [Myxococcales bacterium]|nr:NUDIX domain-containing protein [Myxococcales bacterium]
MPPRPISAGLLLVRARGSALEFFLVHPGGPYFAEKDDGSWGIPKGLLDPGEEPLETARRELAEETGFGVPPGPYVAIGEVRLKSGKRVVAWAVAADVDPEAMVSNTFEMEWPPRSGRKRRYPEVDRGGWFDREAAGRKMSPAQVPFLDRAIAARAQLDL